MKRITSFLLCAMLLFVFIAPSYAADTQETPYEDSAFFSYGEYTLHYRVINAAQPRGRIMMIHGFAQSTYEWQNLSAILADNGYTCVLVDLPDFGYSSREKKETEKLPREELIHALMVSLSEDPWYLAGHSMGGYVALSVAQAYPESVKNLLLYGTSGNDGRSVQASSMMANDLVASVMGPFMEMMGKNPLLVRLLLMTALQDMDYAMHYDVNAIIAPFRIKGTGTGAVYNFSQLTATDYDAVSRMNPILFMNGDKDTVIADSARVNLRQALPKGSVDCIVKGGGHMFIENMAEETARVTMEFLSDK